MWSIRNRSPGAPTRSLTMPRAGAAAVATMAVCVVGVATAQPVVSPPAAPACATRTNDTVAKLVECIRTAALWNHILEFQKIADRHPGPDGHPSRNSGEPGYQASVEYVAKKMREAGYKVRVQTFYDAYFSVRGTPTFAERGTDPQQFRLRKDWYVAYNSGAGRVTGAVQAVGRLDFPATARSNSGCSKADFRHFIAGRLALVQEGGCDEDTKVTNAEHAGAAGVIIFNSGNSPDTKTFPQVFLSNVAHVPVLEATYAVGKELAERQSGGRGPSVDIDVRTVVDPHRADYNLIADSPFGDPNHTVVVDAHLDAIFGGGLLDNASGSATILEVALQLARTPTRNHLRFIWFGGEETGLYGSAYYVAKLPPAELARIAFDIDADVTGTPNFVNWIADPANATDVANYPANVVPASRRGNAYFVEYFASIGLPVTSAPFGNDGTDSSSFSYVGVPNTGILTAQGCCKVAADVAVFGGLVGNFEGHVPGFDGGCVDYGGRWCDNWYNVDPHVLTVISKAVGYVTFKLADDPDLSRPAVRPVAPTAQDLRPSSPAHVANRRVSARLLDSSHARP